MSIVQDALKKAQNLRKTPEGILFAERAKGRKNFVPPLLLIVFVLLLFITIKQAPSFLSQAIYKPIATIDTDTARKPEPLPIAEPYTPFIESESRPRAPKQSLPSYVLSGVMELVDGPRAIINNVIVSTGDMISGAQVKKIDKNRVILQKEGSFLTLGME